MDQKDGIHTGVNLREFGPQEIVITNNLSSIWFVSHSGVARPNTKFKFPYIFLKPTEEYKQKFNFYQEILCIFHPYNSIDSRVLEAIDKILKANDQRIDQLCVILVTNAEKLDDAVSRSEKEGSSIIVPFTYRELTGGVAGKDRLITEKLEKILYTKDLFAISSVLKTDKYFFARRAEVQRIIGHYQNGENSSLFGLRRIGKSSLLWAVVRALKVMNVPVALIDCADPGIHKPHWNKTLFRIKEALYRTNEINKPGHDEDKYTEEDATKYFALDISAVKEKFQKPVFFLFDEIENICFDVSPTEHWKSGGDFLNFWQAIRSTFQQYPNIFSFLVCGTNPIALESTRLPNNVENPIYKYIEPYYLGFFGLEEIENMINSLSRYMGITFEREVFTYLIDDFGGHPFLIKQVCSYLRNSKFVADIPKKITIKKTDYQNERANIASHTRNYIELILEVLTQRYPKEFSLLRYLAAGDEQTFEQCSASEPYLVEHLSGYGLIHKEANKYYFRIKAVENAVKHDARDLTCPEAIEERWALISKERNQFEHRLRNLVRQTLKISIGPMKAKEEIINCMQKQIQKDKAEKLTYDKIFDGELYFLDLKRVVLKHWEKFQFAFEENKPKFSECLDSANKFRNDAHAKTISKQDFKKVMPQLVWLSRSLDENS